MNESKLNELLNEMAIEVVCGTLLKTIKLRLARMTNNQELVSKLVRIVEIRAQGLGA